MYPQRSVMTCGLATALEPPHFNHAPVWGATRSAPGKRTGETRFNPRTRVGCDLFADECRQQRASFNPRTRVGCDTHSRSGATKVKGFNPRTRVGCDADNILRERIRGLFQSTHPRGVRRDDNAFKTSSLLFQSTHPRGVRLGAMRTNRYRRFFVSIHAPA